MAVTVLLALGLSGRLPVQASVPYVADANTVLLDHLDGGTLGAFYGYYGDTGPCGSPRPQTGPNMGFVTGPNGLSGALLLCHLNGAPEGNGSYVRYPNQMLSLPNGTLEFWVFLASYGTGLSLVEQGPYYGACAGWTFGMGVGTNGVVSASAWNAFNLTSGASSVPLNRWTHLAVSWGATGAKLYIDGVQVGADPNMGMPASGYGGNVMFRVGSHCPGVCGRIDEIRISNVQRTTFNVPTAAPVSNMKAYAGFTIHGATGTPCQVQYAVSPATNNWQVLSNFNLPSNPYVFIDYTCTNTGSRFYKALLNP